MQNFQQHQEIARRRARRLVVVYSLGLAVFVAATSTLLMALIALLIGDTAANFADIHPTQRNPWAYAAGRFFSDPLQTLLLLEGQLLWLACIAFTLALVLSASAWKMYILRAGGGASVALSMGGSLVTSADRQFHKKRLVNIVEEMAIASGTPVPTVFILEDEHGVNAFAAGNSVSDAAVAVTHGAATSLSRDQLQGVIAHEFSHILSQDMRLNIRLIGYLYGILAVQMLGRVLIDVGRASGGSSRRDADKSAGAIILIGALFFLLGLIGAFIARIIKGLISQQNEFRADADAVAFTRNPDGIAQALRVIGGHHHQAIVKHSNAEECSHMFFAHGLSGFFASLVHSHPPLKERILRIQPNWDGTWLDSSNPQPGPDATPIPIDSSLSPATSLKTANDLALADWLAQRKPRLNFPARFTISQATQHVGALTPADVFKRIESARVLLNSIPADILDAARQPHDARAVILALLLDTDSAENGELAVNQLKTMALHLGDALSPLIQRLAGAIARLDPAVRMPLVEVALAALASLSRPQFLQFRSAMDEVIQADRFPTLFQVCIYAMTKTHLDRRFGLARPSAVQYYSLARLGDECSILLNSALLASRDRSSDPASILDPHATTLGARLRPMPPDELTPARIMAALSVLAQTSTPKRTAIVHAIAHIIGRDAQVDPLEAQLLRAVADCLQVPTALILQE